MATQLKKPAAPETDLWPVIEAALRREDGAAAREHLAAGFPIYYSEADTPADAVIKEYPDGRRELVRFDHDGEHRVAAVA
jgi:hypothetical protein